MQDRKKLRCKNWQTQGKKKTNLLHPDFKVSEIRKKKYFVSLTERRFEANKKIKRWGKTETDQRR